jgi:hypothetical protein
MRKYELNYKNQWRICMKKVLLVLVFVLLTSLVFAEAAPQGPLADPAGASGVDPTMFWHMWRFMAANEVQGQPEDPLQFTNQVRYGEPDAAPKGSEAPGEPQRIQARSGDRTGDCDGDPDRLQTKEQTREKLQDGSCSEEPDQTRARSGK